MTPGDPHSLPDCFGDVKTVDVVESALLGLLIEHLLGAGIVQSVQCWQQTPSLLRGLPGAE